MGRVFIEGEAEDWTYLAAIEMIKRKFKVGRIGKGVGRLTHNRHILSIGRGTHPPQRDDAPKQQHSR